jgi:O-antigen ligase
MSSLVFERPQPLESQRVTSAVVSSGGRSAAKLWGKTLLIVIAAGWAAAPAIGFEAALIVTTLVGFGAAVIGLRKPVLGLLGVGILCALEPMARVFLQKGGLLRWNSFNYVLLAAMALGAKRLLRVHDVQGRLLLLLVFLLGFEIAISPSPVSGVQVLLEVVVIFGLLIYFQKGAVGRDAWYWLGVVGGTSSGLGTLAFYSQQSALDYINPNALADAPLAGLFAVCLGILFTENRLRTRAFLLILAALNVALIFLSGSRGALSIACMGVVFLLVLMRLSFRLTFVLAAVIVLAVVVKAQFVAQEERAVGRVGLLFDKNRSLTSRTSGRINLAMGGWYIFRANPFGVGTGGFAANYAQLGNREGLGRFKEGQEMQAHSEWVKILSENGVPGTILLGVFVVSFAASGWARREQGLFPLGLLVTGSLAIGFFSREFQDEALHFVIAGTMTLFQRASDAQARRKAALGRMVTNSSNLQTVSYSRKVGRRFLPQARIT